MEKHQREFQLKDYKLTIEIDAIQIKILLIEQNKSKNIVNSIIANLENVSKDDFKFGYQHVLENQITKDMFSSPDKKDNWVKVSNIEISDWLENNKNRWIPVFVDDDFQIHELIPCSILLEFNEDDIMKMMWALTWIQKIMFNRKLFSANKVKESYKNEFGYFSYS